MTKRREAISACIQQARDFEALGRLDDAIRSYLAALSIRSDLAHVRNDLGLVYQAKGQLAEAIGCYRTALSINPALAAAHFNLGRALQIQGEHRAAADSYQRFLSFDPNYFQAHHNLAIALEAVGQFAEAVAQYKRAFELKPAFYPPLFGLVRTLSKVVPPYHVAMMNDAKRNDAYLAALRSVVTPQSRVFEIGTGAGLMSMLAARLGAAQVTTCEAEPLVAATARRIIADNGFEQRIRVIVKKSTEVMLKSDLPQPAQILVQEVFSSNLLSEGVLPSIEDAKRRLLTPDCRMIPAAASLMIALFGGDIGNSLLVEDVKGLDLRQFNTIVPRIRTIHRKDLDIRLLSDEVEAFKFDFKRESIWRSEEKMLYVRVKESGRCLGVVQWIRLYFDEDAVFENHPSGKTASHWPACTYMNLSPIAVSKNQVATVLATHDKTQPWFEVKNIG